MIQYIKIIAILLLLGLFCMSCTGRPEVGISEDVIYERPMPMIEYEYELGPGDVVEIVYHYTPKPDTSEYYLAVGDVLKVEFAYHKSINTRLTVRPDGNVAMPRIGDVHILGLTPKQLQKKLTEIYAPDFKNPVITITMIQYNRAIDHLKKAITTAPRGQSKLTTVRPDGYITFPMLPDIMAKGKTMPELGELATREYAKLIDNLTISLILKVMKANLVYIMGQVEKPDYYLMEGPHTVSQILSRAGGALDTAKLNTVLVISRDKERRPWGRLLDLEKVLSEGNISEDIVLQQYDVVFVPKSKIARMNLFVEQYINRMIPSNLLGPYDLGGRLIDGSVIEHKPLIR
ncbi:MAG: polysaccharide biosynthesis/export family protein [Desulfobacula sp.]|nr:polysaccharide biosynthesis/export family protein [Desulfobacula sp.]